MLAIKVTNDCMLAFDLTESCILVTIHGTVCKLPYRRAARLGHGETGRERGVGGGTG